MPGCGAVAASHARRPVRVRDLPSAGRPVTLIWIKRVWGCRHPQCEVKTWSEASEAIALGSSLTERAPGVAARRSATMAGRWSTTPPGSPAWTVVGPVHSEGAIRGPNERVVRRVDQRALRDSLMTVYAKRRVIFGRLCANATAALTGHRHVVRSRRAYAPQRRRMA